MNIYDRVLDYISNIAVLKAWPDAENLLEHAASQGPRDWRLPVAVSAAVGGSTEAAIPASASVACSLISILLIDDMLDDDPRGEFLRIGRPQAANLASTFLAAASQCILHSSMESDRQLRALESLTQMLLTVSFGQYLDIQNPADEPAYWRVVRTKSAPFFSTAMELGALAGGAPSDVVCKIGKMGSLYGEIVQIHDDMNDCMAVPANVDWLRGRSPLPILFAESVNHADRSRFLELRPLVSDTDALDEAQQILIRSGAISYCVDQLLRRYYDAETIISRMKLSCPENLRDLLEEMVCPVWRLFETAGPPLLKPNIKGIDQGRQG